MIEQVTVRRGTPDLAGLLGTVPQVQVLRFAAVLAVLAVAAVSLPAGLVLLSVLSAAYGPVSRPLLRLAVLGWLATLAVLTLPALAYVVGGCSAALLLPGTLFLVLGGVVSLRGRLQERLER